MRTRQLSILVAILAALALVACGSSSGGGSDDDTGQPQADVPVHEDTAPPEDTGGPDPQDTGTPDVGTPDAGADLVDPDPDIEPPGGDESTDFSSAVEIAVGESAGGKLSPVDDMDYFTFEGTAGQALVLELFAQVIPFDNETIDTVLTLYDAAQTQVAQNDDPFPRITNDSRIITVLPADGTYYLRVEECWTWAAGLVGASCAEPQAKLITGYTVTITELDGTEAGVVLDDESGDTAGEATQVTHDTGEDDEPVALLGGTFEDGTDVDVYALTIPADFVPEQGRSLGSFALFGSGPNANGSTTGVTSLWIAQADAPDVAIAKASTVPASYVSPPMMAGVDYLVYVGHGEDSVGQNDFYFLRHVVSDSNPVEAEDVANDSAATAEVLSGEENPDYGLISHFVDGDILDVDTDVDHYGVPIPATLPAGSTISATCGSRTSGSGLVDLAIRFVDEEGTQYSATRTETATTNAEFEGFPVADGATQMIIKVDAGSMADDVTGTYYRCGFHLIPAETGDGNL